MHDLWETAKSITVQTGEEIVGGFDVGFDDDIAEEIKEILMQFAYWVEDHYNMPITLWVDVKHRHYLLDPQKGRAGYRFYWVDYESLSVFDNFDDIPVIELAARCEKQSVNDLLSSFAAAITCYFAWLSGLDMHTFEPSRDLTEKILQSYLTRGE